jgi:cytidylate kinase
MYRAVTLAALRYGIAPADTEKTLSLFERCRFEFRPGNNAMRVFIDGIEKTKDIREPKITGQVRHIASAPAIREKLVAMQRDFAARFKCIVSEGRDQGTVVFADAAVKLFLTADPIERAKRRYRELAEAGNTISLEQVLDDQQKRDASDASRAVGPLKPALDAIIVDTTGLDAKQTADELERIVRKRIGG